MCTVSAYSILIFICIIIITILLYYYNFVYILNRIVVGLVSCVAQLGNVSLNFESYHVLGVQIYFLLYSYTVIVRNRVSPYIPTYYKFNVNNI